jgi:hypothetical protein
MKQIIISLLFLGLISGFTQPTSVKYPVVIKFQSICCGVPDDAPLNEMIKKFKKQYKIKTLSTTRIGPMGKEGEYYLAFSLKGMTAKQKLNFKKKIRSLVPTMKDKGVATLEENITINAADLPSRATSTTVNF